MADLDAIKARIRKLREMNEARGCTEAEAEAASAAALRLMTEYGLSEADVEYGEVTLESFARRRHPADSAWRVIAHVCRCAHIFRADLPRLSITYYGRLSDILVAEYLHQIVLGALRRGHQEFLGSDYYHRRRTARTRSQAMRTYLEGLAEGLAEKLIELWWRSTKDVAGASQAHARAVTASTQWRDQRVRVRSAKALAAPKGDRRVREAGLARAASTRLDPAAAGVSGNTKRIGGE